MEKNSINLRRERSPPGTDYDLRLWRELLSIKLGSRGVMGLALSFSTVRDSDVAGLKQAKKVKNAAATRKSTSRSIKRARKKIAQNYKKHRSITDGFETITSAETSAKGMRTTRKYK